MEVPSMQHKNQARKIENCEKQEQLVDVKRKRKPINFKCIKKQLCLHRKHYAMLWAYYFIVIMNIIL